MGKLRKVFWGAAGINNRNDPVRLRFDYRTGITDLAAAVNIVLDDTGRPGRRKGFVQRSTTAFHSLHPYLSDQALAVTGDALALIGADYSVRKLRNVRTGARMSYADGNDGTRPVVFYANGYEQGKVYDGASYPWSAAGYVGPDTSREHTGPPAGIHLLADFGAYLLCAVGSVLFFSRPFAWSLFRPAADFVPFDSRIVMVRPVEGAVFVSTQTRTVVLKGADPKQWALVTVAFYPASAGTDVMVEASRFGKGEGSGEVAVWTSSKGICAGFAGGEFRNLTSDRLVLPDANQGAGLYTDGRYICCLDP